MMYICTMNVAEQIKQARKKANLTQEELAERIGLSGKMVISHYESGTRKPSLLTLEKIANALNCELEINLKRIKGS